MFRAGACFPCRLLKSTSEPNARIAPAWGQLVDSCTTLSLYRTMKECMFALLYSYSVVVDGLSELCQHSFLLQPTLANRPHHQQAARCRMVQLRAVLQRRRSPQRLCLGGQLRHALAASDGVACRSGPLG